MIKKRILIVNCYVDETRFSLRRQTKYPQSMATAFLAGMFCSNGCEIRLYDEMYSGPLEDKKLLSFPDMLVLTGLNTAFDRMLHITAYARTKNPSVVVVAGGPAVRALPGYSELFFDYCCVGDIEQLAEVIRDFLGKQYVSEYFQTFGRPLPRYDLAYWIGFMGYVESSRNCYFKCNFCSLTAENKAYKPYDIEYIEHQLLAQYKAWGKRGLVLFLDNNFGGANHRFFDDRINLLKKVWERGFFWRWAALVSNEFFLDDSHLAKAKESGCVTFFSGLETFDKKALRRIQKAQNTCFEQVDVVRKCLNAGIAYFYGMVLDVSTRKVSELRKELEFILDTPEIPLPSYISIAVPMLNTPFFHECVREKRLLADIKLRDLDSTTLTLKPVDSLEETVCFIRDIQSMAGYRKKVINHSRAFYSKYKSKLLHGHMPVALHGALLLCVPQLFTASRDLFNILKHQLKGRRRTFVGSTEPADGFYKPAFRVDSKFAHYFNPTMLTDKSGDISEQLSKDLLK